MKPVAAATNGLDANGNHREANLMEVSAKDPEAMASQTDPRRIKFGEHLRHCSALPACIRPPRVVHRFFRRRAQHRAPAHDDRAANLPALGAGHVRAHAVQAVGHMFCSSTTESPSIGGWHNMGYD